MRNITYILYFVVISLLWGCDKIALPRDNPLDEKNDEGLIKGVNLKFDSFTVYTDSNGDGIVNIGETVGLDIKLKNTGSSTAKNVYATFSCNSPYVSSFSPTTKIEYSDIYSGSSVYHRYSYNGPTLTFKISNSTPSGTKIPINIQITDAQGNSWNDSFDVEVLSTNAIVKFGSYIVDNDNNGDGIVNIGETVGLDIKLKNTGSSTAKNVYATFSCNSPYVSSFSPTTKIEYSDIYSGSSVYHRYSYNGPTLTFKISNSTPSGTKIPINIQITDAQGNSWNDSFDVVAY